MSLKIKTPTRNQFDHVEFPCGEREMGGGSRFRDIVQVRENSNLAPALTSPVKGPALTRQDSQPSSKFRKRAYSESRGGASINLRDFAKRGKTTKHSRSSLEGKLSQPRRFLNGGNITDPLNLNSLCRDEIGRVLNESTPQSSPMTLPDHKQHVAVLIPTNINDPLNLNSGEDLDVGLISPKGINKKKKKHKKRKSGSEDLLNQEEDVTETEPLQILISTTTTTTTVSTATTTNTSDCIKSIPADNTDDDVKLEVIETAAKRPGTLELDDKLNKIFDKLISPASQPVKPTQQTHKARKRKRTSSECKSEATDTDSEKTPVKEKQSPVRPVKEKQSPIRPKPGPKYRRSVSQGHEGQHSSRGKHRQDKFIHGNYNRYYGYRNPMEEDHRLKVFCRSWFEGLEVLDIGCNVGHVTLNIARDFGPKKIVGMDIDGRLIGSARKNVQYYLSTGLSNAGKFPVSLTQTHGPITTAALPEDPKYPGFPHNVHFMQGSYVLDRDELVDLQKEEYDVILVLSVTKWIHLNSGDDGLKRAFRRMYKQLRPGGKLILEPQSWASYKKKKKLTEAIGKMFQQIKLRPEHFREYLLSPAVGFVTCDLIDTPFNKSKGFQRPLYLYTKGDGSEMNTPRDVTPLMNIDCTPHTTPQPSSGLPTPSAGWGTPGDYGGYGYSANYGTPSRDWGWGGHTSQSNTPNFDIGPGSQGVTPGSSCHDTPTHQLHVSWPGHPHSYDDESQHERRPGSSLDVIEECSVGSYNDLDHPTPESTANVDLPNGVASSILENSNETTSPSIPTHLERSPVTPVLASDSPDIAETVPRQVSERERRSSGQTPTYPRAQGIRRSYSDSMIE